ncbi:uncharacterized protein [Malus domestica]|uniref:uncharacterized protein n=1 Tax=Malus domestica TaxID=3750 RepID=UPI0039769D47
MSGLISLSVIISNILFASLTKPSLQRVSIKTLKVLKWEDVEVGEPKKGEIHVKKEAIGINFTDVYYRKGLYKAATLPYTPGVEACGVVIAVGPDLIGRQVGDLVAYAGQQMGSDAKEQILPTNRSMHVPPSIYPKVAASLMLKG